MGKELSCKFGRLERTNPLVADVAKGVSSVKSPTTPTGQHFISSIEHGMSLDTADFLLQRSEGEKKRKKKKRKYVGRGNSPYIN
eukprot:1157180-Pelagomonas_calceolata.AAC.1